jgi:phosphatidylinositol-3-phosphatase
MLLGRITFRVAAITTALLFAVGLAAYAGTAANTSGAQAATQAEPTAPTVAANTKLADVKHIWVINLENTSYSKSFGTPSNDPYLSKTLVGKGALLTNYFGIGHDSLTNYIAEVSGQAPNFQTNNDCGYYSNFLQFGYAFDKWTKYGQLTGDGCVLPGYVQTVGNQLTKASLDWKSYNEDMGNDPKRDLTKSTVNGPACAHGTIGRTDLTDDLAPANDSYANRHNGFAYFHSVIDDRSYCRAHVLSLAPLRRDLRSARSTPALSFVTPNTCHDLHDDPCQNGEKGGFAQSERWLKTWIPRIMASPAYADGGLIVITFDESGDDADAQDCCGTRTSVGLDDPTHPNTDRPGIFGPGGGRVGAVLLSRFIKPGTVSAHGYNHYSLLRSVETAFGLRYLGDASAPGIKTFGADIFSK